MSIDGQIRAIFFQKWKRESPSVLFDFSPFILTDSILNDNYFEKAVDKPKILEPPI